MFERVACALQVGLLACVAACSSTPPPASRSSPLLGDLMPNFQSKTLSGNHVISAGYNGHTVVVSFVASKCAPCERTLAAAQASYAEDRELVVVGVFRPDDAASVRSLAARLELRFPIVMDRDGALARQFKIEDFPSTFVIDRAGRVRWVGGPDVTEDGLVAAIQAAD